MKRGINTKCLHLEDEEGCFDNYGSLSYPIYQTATYAHPAVPDMITADCRIQPENIWRRS